MKIRVLRNLGRDFPDLLEGQEVEIDRSSGEGLVARGLAEMLAADPPPLPAEPIKEPEPMAAKEPEPTAEATEELKSYRNKATRQSRKSKAAATKPETEVKGE